MKRIYSRMQFTKFRKAFCVVYEAFIWPVYRFMASGKVGFIMGQYGSNSEFSDNV
jgi:hypothetical protein